VTTFKSVVNTISNRNGLYATFDPKPIADREGNGFHINLSLRTATGGEITEETKKHFMAGILNYVPDMTAFLNPDADSYKRLGEFKAPKYITWSHQNRSQLIRIPSETGIRKDRAAFPRLPGKSLYRLCAADLCRSGRH
jgi:glutamine synthetase